MTLSENPNGRYPVMQNPGDTRIPEGVEIPQKKRVLVLNGARLVNPNGYDEIVSLYPHGGEPTAQDEARVLEETR